jgi:hypothetical protein
MGLIADFVEKKLEQEARGRGLLVWLDKKGEFTGLADSLERRYRTGEARIPFFAFRGSFLELMARSQAELSGKIKPTCIVHVPGMDEADIAETPLYEMYCAGQRWRISLETAIRECAASRIAPRQLEGILASNPLMLEKAESELQNIAETPRELQPLLTRYGENGLVLEYIRNPKKLCEGPGSPCVDPSALMKYITNYLGFDPVWAEEWHGEAEPETIEEASEAVVFWMLCVEFVGDLVAMDAPSERLRALKSMEPQYRKRIEQCLSDLRRLDAPFYLNRALQAQEGLEPSEMAIDCRFLGQVDTFRFEADLFLKKALQFLAAGKWDEAGELARIRLPGSGNTDLSRTFWLTNDKERQWFWEWLDAAARLGSMLVDFETLRSGSRDDWLGSYTGSWWKIDQAHRNFVVQTEKFNAVSSTIETREFFAIRKNLALLARRHVDLLCRGWNEVCEQNGFAGGTVRRQRHFYRDWLSPLVKAKKKIAIVLVDALRFELGKDLERLVSDDGWKSVSTDYMLSELPSITSVGMNLVFAPSEVPSFALLLNDRGLVRGAQVGQRAVSTPDSRLALLREASGKTCDLIALEDFIKADDREVLRLAASEILVLASREIDTMGESGLQKYGIDFFERSLGNIKQALMRLREAGIAEIVVTADHGFLLSDEFMESGIAPRLDHVDRRYAVDEPRNGADLISVAFGKLGYETSTEGQALVFARGSGILTNSPSSGFYHGGSSLQEMVVPVLVLTSPKTGSQAGLSYQLSAEVLSPALGYQRIKLLLSSSELFATEAIEFRLRADDEVEILVGDAGESTVTGEVLRLAVGASCELFFQLRGSVQRSKIELVALQPGLRISGLRDLGYFPVQPSPRMRQAAADASAPPRSSSVGPGFHPSIPTEFHAALANLRNHGMLTEQFLSNSLGGGPTGARKARKFAASVDEWDKVLPFKISLEQSPEGKVYRCGQ